VITQPTRLGGLSNDVLMTARSAVDAMMGISKKWRDRRE